MFFTPYNHFKYIPYNIRHIYLNYHKDLCPPPQSTVSYLTSPPSEGLGEAPLWAWGGTSSSPFPLEWQSNSKVEGLRITEPSDVIEATLAR